MTRMRIRPTTASGDGGAFTRNNRPPDDRLPKVFAQVAAEFDSVHNRLLDAERTLRELNDPVIWQAEADRARRADADASAAAARAGGEVANPTEHIDALHGRLRRAEADVEALTGALKLVTDDFANAREIAKADATHDRALTRARAKVAKAAADLSTASTELGAALALHEWIHDHAPYDPSLNVDVHDIWEPANRIVPADAGRIPVRLANITQALTRI